MDKVSLDMWIAIFMMMQRSWGVIVHWELFELALSRAKDMELIR